MSSLNQLTTNDFCINFPGIHLSNEDLMLKAKCGELGILAEERETRQEFNFITGSDSSMSNSITAQNLKDWFNQRGTVNIFDNLSDEEYENWKRLLFSKQEDSIILALSMLNTKKRPVPKFFSLWLALAQFHTSTKVRETAQSFVRIYLSKDEIALLCEKKMSTYLQRSFNDASENHFININYLQAWTNLLTPDPIFFKHKYNKYFESKDLIESWEEFNIGEILQHSHSFSLIINSEDGIKSLHFLVEKLNDSKYIGLAACQPVKISPETWACLAQTTTIHLNNIRIDESELNEFLPLPEVTNCNFKTPGELTLSTHLFPKLTWLDLTAKSIKSLKIQEKEETITLLLNLTETQHIPDEVYHSETVASLHLKFTEGIFIDDRIQNMTRLIELAFGSKTECLQLSDELFKLPKLINIFELDHEVLQKTLSPTVSYSGPSAMILGGKALTEFPYYLSNCKKLLQLCFRAHEITEIDDRVANFKNLFQISFPDGNMKKIPDSLMKIPRLAWLDLYRQDISEISFEWIVFAYRRKALVNLGGNPINTLPEIPADFKIEDIVQDEIESYPRERRPQKGWVSLNRGNIPDEQIERYKEFFGDKFLNLS